MSQVSGDYSPDLIQEAVRLAAALGSAAQAAQQLGIPTRTVQRWAQNRVPEPQPHPMFDDLRLSELDLDEVFDAIGQITSVIKKADVGQSEASVTLTSTDPIVIVPDGDQHLGSLGTDHEEFRRRLAFVRSTPGLYLIYVGDEIDNFTSFKSAEAVLGQVIPPKVQKRLLSKVISTLAAEGKLLARTWGNHVEEFDERTFGGAIEGYNELIPYLKDSGRLTLKVGSVEYRLLVKHNFRGGSRANINSGAKQAVRLDWPDADIAISGHTHNGVEFDSFLHDGRRRLAVKVGTLKVDDIHAQRHYGKPTTGLAGIVLRADLKQAIPFEKVEDAVLYRDALVGWSQRRVG